MQLINLKQEIKNRNQKVQGYIAVGASEVLLPITVICGKEAGKTILITGGIHNAEYVGIQAVLKLSETLTSEHIDGNILLLPLVNRTGFENRTGSYVFEDGKNINREFPGKEDGTLTERICHFLEKDIFSQIDYYIDLHCGDGHEELVPYVYCQGKAREDVLQVSRKMAQQVNVKYIVQSNSATGGAYNYAGTIGIPGILLERGNLGVWSENEVAEDLIDVQRILMALGFLQDFRETRVSNSILIKKTIYQGAGQTGCWYPNYRAGEHVEKGAVLGIIKNYFGHVLETLTAKEKGVILYQIGSLSVLKAETVIAYGLLPN